MEIPSTSTPLTSKPPTISFLLKDNSACTCFYKPGIRLKSVPVMILSSNSHRDFLTASKKCPPFLLRASQFDSPIVLEGEEKELWDSCKNFITSLNFSPEEVDVILSKAFGWKKSPYWTEERIKEVPNTRDVEQILGYLRSLGLSDDDMHKLLKKFPEVLGCKLDNELKNNVAVLERDWGIKGSSLRSLLLRNPKVLGYNVDCKGDCIAQCTRCWVRF